MVSRTGEPDSPLLSLNSYMAGWDKTLNPAMIGYVVLAINFLSGANDKLLPLL